jgi:AAHS family 4-hydroxybenzoate transporter-like MFS transporter
MVFYFTNSWLPTLLIHSAAGPGGAAIATSLFIFGGVAGGLAIMRPIDRMGFLPVPILFLCGIPALIAVGVPGMALPMLLTIVVIAGFCLYGLQFGLIAAEGPLYPPPVRGRGVGFCFAAARVGATLGPLVGGFLISMHLPTRILFMIATIPLVIGVVVAAIITPLYRKQVVEADNGPAPVYPDAVASLGGAVASEAL